MQYQIKTKGKKRYWLNEKKSFKRGRKKIISDTCQRSTVFWQIIFLQELQNGHRDVRRFIFLGNCNYSKVFFTGIKCNPCGGTLCYVTFRTSLDDCFYMLLMRKLLRTPIRLIKLSFKKKIPYSTVRKSWINFTSRLVAGSHVEKNC